VTRPRVQPPSSVTTRAHPTGCPSARFEEAQSAIHWIAVFGPDGLVTRWETFEATHEAEALARFDELVGTGSPAPAPAVRRRVQPNEATVYGSGEGRRAREGGGGANVNTK
jgi:hypothetical protein